MLHISADADKILRGNDSQLRNLLVAAATSEPNPGAGFETLDSLPQLLGHLQESGPDLVSEAEEGGLTTVLEQSLRTKNISLAAALKVRLTLADKVFAGIFHPANFSRPLDTIIGTLRLPFIISALTDDRFYSDSDNPMRRLAESVFTQSITWYGAPAGKVNRTYPQKLQQLLTAVAAVAGDDTGELARLQREFCASVTRETQRAEATETRISESEIGTAKIAAAEKNVIQLINDSLAGHRLPLRVATFIQTTWKNELQFVLINDGPEADTWTRWKTILKSLAWVFSAPGEVADQQCLYTEIPRLLDSIDTTSTPYTCQNSEYQAFIEILERSLIQVLKNDKDVEYTQVKALDVPGETPEIKTMISQSLAQQADSFEVGSWFLFSIADDDDAVIRCKFAVKIPATDQLLFVNRNGHKTMLKSVDEFILCLSSRIARPLSLEPPIALSLQQSIDHLVDRHQSNLQRSLQERDRRARITAQLEIKKQERQEALAEIRKAAASKAKREAKALAREKALREYQRQRESQRRQQQAQREAECRRADFATALEQLQIGAWMEIPAPSGILTRCKLAVNIRSSGKYIFVDRLGIKVAEYYRENLVELLAANSAKILNRGEKFEDQLAKIVKGLRRDVK